MTVSTKLKAVAVLALFAIPFAFGVRTEQASAQEAPAPEAAQNQPAEQPAADAAYAYNAQPDDTYSQMARKAIQTYGIVNDVRLSAAQIIYAETMLTQDAGSPLLMLGQKVTILESDVKEWVESAQKMTAKQTAAWQPYTVGVNFNTNNVGESQE